ncbi:unnamed protein product, partial [marine sediment metagenome]
MKRFLKKRWHGIPIGIIASILITGIVVAGTLIGVTQTITQEITEPPKDYGSITADPITLNSVYVGKNVSQSFSGAVVVVVGPDGVGKYLHLKLNTTSDLYQWCGVTLTSLPGDNPVGKTHLINVTYGEIASSPRDFPHCSVQLTEPG